MQKNKSIAEYDSLSLAVLADIEDVPEKVRGKIALHGGVLHISEDLKGDLDMTNLATRLRRRGVLKIKFHKPSDFVKLYAQHAVRCGQGANSIQQLAIDLIARAYTAGATDIHIVDTGAYTRIKFRILGDLCEDSQLDADTGKRVISVIYGALGQSADSPAFAPGTQQDGRIVKRDYLPQGVHAVRIHTEPRECASAEDGVGTFMTLRLQYDSTDAKGTLEERLSSLGFTHSHCEIMRSLTQRTGLIVLSGATGHGKSTALKHIMEAQTVYIPERAYHSVEDPPEFRMLDVNQVRIVSKEDETDRSKRAAVYIKAIAGANRSDSDVVMIGEIRYWEAAMAAIDAALTGQAVWTTTHANNAFGIITRFVNLFRIGNIDLPLSALCDPNVLAGLEYQRLIPVLCPDCRRAWREMDRERRALALPGDLRGRLIELLEPEDFDTMFVQGDGCDTCNKRGFSGQRVAAEVVAMDLELLELLSMGQMAEAHRQWRKKGGLTYIEHALDGIKKGFFDPAKTELRLGVPLTFGKFFESERGGAR